jgi:aminopeptidase N
MRLKTTVAVIALIATATLANAQRLPRTIFPIHYDLTFVPDLGAATFRGEEVIDISNQLPATSIKLHAMQLKLIDADVIVGTEPRKATVTYDEPNEMVTLTVAEPIPIGRASIHIVYTGILNNDLHGLYLGHTKDRPYASTQFEAAAARYAFPSFDEPEMKATFNVTAIVDEGDIAISNGAVLFDRKGPEIGKHMFRFATTPRMSTYLVALTVGPFVCLKDEVDGIPLRVCATKDQIANGRFALEATKASVSFFNQYYGVRYPFAKLDQVAVPDFAAGAMENTADIIYRETALLVSDNDSVERKKSVAGTIAHEIAHQWFGDLVTMKWWNDLWLNEGFATFMSPKPLKAWKPDWEFEASEVADNRGTLTTDSLSSTRPIRAEATTSAQIENMFDAIAYGKTAWMLRMVESYIGETAMRKGIDDYIASNAYGNTAAEDFTRAMDRASSKPVAEVISSFVRNAGLPLIIANSVCDGGTNVFTLTQQRFLSDPASTNKQSAELWTIPICFGDRCELLRERQQIFRVAGCDPIYLNHNARGYYITQYPAADVPRLAKSASLSKYERYALIREDWMLVRSGRRDVADFLKTAEALRGNREPRTLQPLLSAFDFIGERYTTPQSDAAFRKWVSDYLRPLATELGWTPRPDETEAIHELRTGVLRTLGFTGRDRATLDKASELTKRVLKGDANAVDRSLTETAFELAAVRSDPALYEQLLQAYAKSNDPQEQRRLRGVIAVFRDPKLAIRTLEWALTPAIRSQDAGGVFSEVLSISDVQRVVWDYYVRNWDRFAAKLPNVSAGGGRGGPIVALGSICDAALRDDAVRRVAQAIERATQCIASRDLQAPKLEALFGRADALVRP